MRPAWRGRPNWLKGDGAATTALMAATFLAIVMISMAAVTFWETRSSLAPEFIRNAVFRSALFVEPETSSQVGAVFGQETFDLAKVRGGRLPSPRIIFKRIPGDLSSLEPPERQKEVFLRILLPAVLLANEEIQLTRTRVLRLDKRLAAGLTLSPAQRGWLGAVAGRFGVDREDLDAGHPDIAGLLERVDIIPVELALAQGGIESGWGTARVAVQGNALFGQRVWNRDNAVAADPGVETLYRTYDNVLDATRSYALNLNTHRAYDGFRKRRLEMRKTGNPLDAASLAGQLLQYSERGQAYVDQIRTVIAVNKLTDFAQSRLAPN